MSKKEKYEVMDLTKTVRTGNVFLKPVVADIIKLDTEVIGTQIVIYGFTVSPERFIDKRCAGITSKFNLKKACDDLNKLKTKISRDTYRQMRDVILIVEERNKELLDMVDYKECM